jgi:DNA-binding IclR family transcriptional regulator
LVTNAVPAKKSSLQVLGRTFAILNLFSESQREWTTTEVARATNLPVATAHRILGVLLEFGYVSRDEETRRYRLGMAALKLGQRARDAVNLRSVVEPILRRLANDTDETAILAVLDTTRDRAVCVERVESSQPLRLSIEPGREVPLHAGAQQKVLFAYLPRQERDELLARPLAKISRGTITDPRVLQREIDEIAARGWAISIEENNLGAWGVAVPILDERQDVVASIGLAGPSPRLSRRTLEDAVVRLKDAAENVATELGSKPAEIDVASPTLKRGIDRALASQKRVSAAG